MNSTATTDVEHRARLSGGTSSDDAVYRMVLWAFQAGPGRPRQVLDVGCGTGTLQRRLEGLYDRYAGADVVRFESFPAKAEWVPVDVESGRVPLPDGFADVTLAVETIEHVENPRAFMRELVRLTSPGGWVIVTTPNQLSFLSKLTLVVKNQFNAFLDGCYPAHLSALLESDLRRIAAECGLEAVRVTYSKHGRIPGTGRHYPRALSAAFSRALSDNVLLMARIPHVSPAS